MRFHSLTYPSPTHPLRRPPVIPTHLQQKLQKIPHDDYPVDFPYIPASAVLNDDFVVECAMFWGYSVFVSTYPPSRYTRFIDIRNVVEVMPSKYQLLPKFAKKVFIPGKDSHSFTLTMKDGSKFHCETGPIVDFIEYPKGYGQNDVQQVQLWWTPKAEWTAATGLSEEGWKLDAQRRLSTLHGKPFSWCLFSESQG